MPIDTLSFLAHLQPDALVNQLVAYEAIAAADMLLLTIPNQLGVEYTKRVIESVIEHVAP